jgi:hypothetical protein
LTASTPPTEEFDDEAIDSGKSSGVVLWKSSPKPRPRPAGFFVAAIIILSLESGAHHHLVFFTPLIHLGALFRPEKNDLSGISHDDHHEMSPLPSLSHTITISG